METVLLEELLDGGEGIVHRDGHHAAGHDGADSRPGYGGRCPGFHCVPGLDASGERSRERLRLSIGRMGGTLKRPTVTISRVLTRLIDVFAVIRLDL